MTKTQKLSLIVALTLLSATSLTRSSHAGAVYGTWSGGETVITQEFLYGQYLGTSYRTNIPATCCISYDSGADALSMSINDMSFWGQVRYPQTVFFGPESASGSVSVNNYPGGGGAGDFFLTYRSILPDGTIDTSIGGAVADITLDEVGPDGTGNVYHASFQSVPEPSSIVQAASGVLLIAIFAWIERHRSRATMVEAVVAR